MMKYFVEHGADVNCKDVENNSVLHYAARHRLLETVKCLVERGADVNCKTNKNESALHFSFRNRNLEMVKYLVEHDGVALM